MSRHVSYSRLFYEGFLPGAVVSMGDAHVLVVGSDNDGDRAQTINADLLCDVLAQYLARWQGAGGEVDEPLHAAVAERRFVIRTPNTVFVSPFPLLLRCSKCRLIDQPGRIPRAARVSSLANTLHSYPPRVSCRACGSALQQVPSVEIHYCGHIGNITPPRSAKGRRVRYHSDSNESVGGGFSHSYWSDYTSEENLGRSFRGACPACLRQEDKTQARTMTAQLRGGRGEAFYSHLLQFIALTPKTTQMLAAVRSSVVDAAEPGRAFACGLLDLQSPEELRANMHILSGVDLPARDDAPRLEGERDKLQKSIERLQGMPDLEQVVGTLEEKLAALTERIRCARGLFVGADAYFDNRELLCELGRSQRAAEAALIRGEFHQRSLTAEAAAAAPAQRLLLDDLRLTLLQDYGIREVLHLDDLAVVLAAIGFTRQASKPSVMPQDAPLRLNAFSDEVFELGGKTPVYALPTKTEALLLRLDPCRVLRFCVDNLKWTAPPEILNDPKRAHAYILTTAPALVLTPDEIRQRAANGEDVHAIHVFGLLHSLSHGALRAAHGGSGYDVHSLVECLFPADFSVVISVAPRKDFASGGLHTLYRYGLQSWFEQAARDTLTCVFDPICSQQNGSCHGCMQLSLGCQTSFNHGVSRAYLHGGSVTDASGQTLWIRRGFWS